MWWGIIILRLGTCGRGSMFGGLHTVVAVVHVNMPARERVSHLTHLLRCAMIDISAHRGTAGVSLTNVKVVHSYYS